MKKYTFAGSGIISVISTALALILICALLTGCGEDQKKSSLQLAPGEIKPVGAEVLAAQPGQEDAAAAQDQPQAPAPDADPQEIPAPDEAQAPDAPQDLPEQEPGNENTPAPARKYTSEDYEAAGVNELNSVPILMYHRIYDLTNEETDYTGGNVDADGYNRTYEAFENDLQMYYDMGYRCMRLTDYVDGNIDVPFGYSPIILTFDDGRTEAAIDGFDADGTPLFKPHTAIGIMEKFKKEHPDFNLTATFFLNDFFFDDIESYEDNVRVMNWLIDHGYDIGNHTIDHPLLEDCTEEEITEQVGGLYKILEEAIPGRYVNIVALPYGSPTSVEGDSKYDRIFYGNYEGHEYTSKAALLCGWTRSYSPFVTAWDNTCIRRIRGYDNNGEDFDIEFNFEQLNAGRRYISDGDPNTVVIRADEEEDWLADTGGREVIRY